MLVGESTKKVLKRDKMQKLRLFCLKMKMWAQLTFKGFALGPALKRRQKEYENCRVTTFHCSFIPDWLQQLKHYTNDFRAHSFLGRTVK